MRFYVSEEHDQLRREVRRFLEETSPTARVRELMDTVEGYDADAWRRMAGQLGLPATAVPEEYGGAGLSFLELSVVLEEMGRALYCGPFLATAVLAVQALLHCGDEESRKRYLPGITAGTVATLASTEDGGGWDAEPAAVEASSDGRGGWVLDGVKTLVPDGHVADLVLVTGRSPAGVSLFAVEGSADGLSRIPLPTLDQTRRLARLELRAVPARLVGADGGASPGLVATRDLAAVAVAAEQVGCAQRCLDMAVDYAKVREQFGRPIGSFQALKHRCADLLLEVESARSAAYFAAWAAAEGSEELPVAASLAQAYCSDACFHAAAENIQIHGGIGYTWEHDAHLYFKRAKSSQQFLGAPAEHRERLAQRIGL